MLILLHIATIQLKILLQAREAGLTNDKNLYEKINLMRNHGIRRSNSISNKHGNWYYEVNDLGYNYNLLIFNVH